MAISTAKTTPQAAVTPRVPWNPLLAIAYAAFVFFAASILASLVVSFYPLLSHWSHAHAKDWFGHSTIAQFWTTLVAEALTFSAVALFVTFFKKTIALIGFGKPKWRDIGVGLLAFSVYFVVLLVLTVILRQYVPALNLDQKQEIGFDNVYGHLDLVLTFVSLVILPPVVEELVFRGLIFTSLRKWVNFYGAAIITSVLFALPHLAEGGAAGPLYIGGIDTLLLSLVLCYIREKTGSVWAGILVHALKNSLAFVSLYLLGGK